MYLDGGVTSSRRNMNAEEKDDLTSNSIGIINIEENEEKKIVDGVLRDF